MKKNLLTVLALAVSVAFACDNYDDSELKGRVEKLENEYSALAQQCQNANDNIVAMQTSVKAISEAKYVSAVTSSEEGTTIKFTDGTSVLVKNGAKGDTGAPGQKGDPGKDGIDGVTPVVGVKADGDVYYWTVNGDWILDNGSRIAVQGGGAVPPQLKVENGQWYLSTDGGKKWEAVEGGKAGAAITVTEDEDNVYLKIDEENTVTLPKATQQAFKLILSKTGEIAVNPGSKLDLEYSVACADASVVVVAETKGYEAKVIPTDEKSGVLKITAPETLPADGYVMLKAVKNSTGEFSAQIVSFEAGGLVLITEAVEVPEEGGNFDVKIATNIEYKVEIPAEVTWIELAPQTKALEQKTLVFNVQQNKGAQRTAVVGISAADGSIAAQNVTFIQAAGTVQTEVSIAAELGKVFYSDATLNWTDAEGVEAYDIYVADQKVGSVPAGVQTYKLTGLKAGTAYSARIVVDEKRYAGQSNAVDFITGSIAQYKHNVGPTHICMAFENLSGGTSENNRGFKVQLSKSADESGIVFDQYLFDGSVSGKATSFGTTSYFGHTESKATGEIKSRVSIGNLSAGTSYWFRVKVAGEYTLSSPMSGEGMNVTVTSPAGESEWSEWIECKTEAAHVASSKEIIYEGFDAFCIGTDYVNMSMGMYPYPEGYKFNGGDNDAIFDSNVVKWPWTGEWRLAANNAIKVHGWGFADYGAYVDGAQEHGGLKNLVGTEASGTFKGWHITDDFCPAMGCVLGRTTVAAGGHYVSTPVLNSSLLGSTPTPCVLTFKECYITTGQPIKNKESNQIVIEVWRNGEASVAANVTMDEGIFNGQKADKLCYLLDYAFTEHSVELNLCAGDAVCIKEGTYSRCAIDDICISVK